MDYTVFVAADDRAAKATYDALFSPKGFGISPVGGQCVAARAGMALLMILAYCGGGQSLADSLGEHHFDELLDRVAPSVWLTRWLPGSNPPGPHWLQLATRGYAASAYRDAAGIETLDEARRARSQLARRMAEPLSSLTALPEPGAFPDEAAEALSFLAGDRLVARAGESAIFEYYRLLGSADSWQEAFEAAFGITIDDFYEEFAEYRVAIGAVASPDAPDEPDGPTLVLLGEMSAATEAALRAEFEALKVFFIERFGGEPVDYTAYVATTRPVAEWHADVLEWVSPGICSWGTRGGDFAMILSTCPASIPEALGDFHIGRIVWRLAPSDSFGPLPPQLELLGPYWLYVATHSYIHHALLRSVKSTIYPGFGSSRGLDASRTERALSSFEHWPPGYMIRGVEIRALTFLAADWLVQRAGEPALFEYYRLLPSSPTLGRTPSRARSGSRSTTSTRRSRSTGRGCRHRG